MRVRAVGVVSCVLCGCVVEASREGSSRGWWFASLSVQLGLVTVLAVGLGQ